MKNIIWDLDGTLIDSGKEIKQSLELALKIAGVDLEKQTKPFIVGPTIDKIIKEAFPIELITDKILSEIIKSFREIYDNSDFEHTKPFLGIEDIIFDTKSFMHHIVTNKPDKPTKKILNKLNWTKYITSIRTPYSDFNGSKVKVQSKSEIYQCVIKKNADNVSTFLGIGDMKTDCLAAKNNNIVAIGVLWGNASKEELLDCCDYLFEDTKQLSDFLYGWKN